MTVPDHELIATSRSAAMLQAGSKLSLDRDFVREVCDELLQQRRLLMRLGADLKTVARHSPPHPPR
jgi:hypothetical protein